MIDKVVYEYLQGRASLREVGKVAGTSAQGAYAIVANKVKHWYWSDLIDLEKVKESLEK